MIIKLPCIFHLTQFSLRGPNTSKWIATLSEKKIALGCMITSFVNSNDQLADIFTKSLRGPRIKYICGKLGAFDLYALACGGVLRISLLIHVGFFFFSL